MAACAGQIAFSDTGYRLFCMVRNQLAGWSLSPQTTVSEKRLGFFWLVVIPLDHLWLVPLTIMGFQRPFGQLANIALELEKRSGYRVDLVPRRYTALRPSSPSSSSEKARVSNILGGLLGGA